MTDKKALENLGLNEFDYMMAASLEYCLSRNISKEMFLNIIDHVQDGYEFLTAMEAQSDLMEIVENHNIMKRYHEDKSEPF